MNILAVCFLVVALFASVILGANTGNKTTLTHHKTSSKLNKTMASKNLRKARQLGYGNQYGGLQSQLSGISSGYGYGYNNAVGMGGVGQGGAGAGYLPLVFGK